MTLKLVFTASLLDDQHLRDSVEKAGKFTCCAVGKGTERNSPILKLNREVEGALADCIGILCKHGFSPSINDILNLVKENLEKKTTSKQVLSIIVREDAG